MSESLIDSLSEMPVDKLLSAISSQPERTLGSFVEELRAAGADVWADTFMGLSFSQISKAVTRKGKTKSRPKIPSIPDFKKDEVRNAYKAEVSKLISDTGMGKGEKDRGLSPLQIRTALGHGNEQQLREVLKELEAEEVVGFAGETKGKKYVPFSMVRKATKLYEAEKAEREAKKAEREAKKAEAEAAE